MDWYKEAAWIYRKYKYAACVSMWVEGRKVQIIEEAEENRAEINQALYE